LGALPSASGPGKPQCRLFDTTSLCFCGFFGESSLVGERTILLHHVKSRGNGNILKYLEQVGSRDCYQLSRWIDFVRPALDIAMGMRNPRLRNAETVESILQSMVRYKSVSPVPQQQLQRQQVCARILNVNVLRALFSEFPAFAVDFLSKLEMDPVVGHDLVPTVLHLKPQQHLITAHTNWDPDVAWREERDRGGRINRVESKMDNMSSMLPKIEVAPFVVGISGLLDAEDGNDNGIGLLRTIVKHDALEAVLSAPTVQVLIKYHWAKKNCTHKTIVEALLFIIFGFIYIMWAVSIPRTSYEAKVGAKDTYCYAGSGVEQLFGGLGHVYAGVVHEPDARYTMHGLDSCASNDQEATATSLGVLIAIQTAMMLVHEVWAIKLQVEHEAREFGLVNAKVPTGRGCLHSLRESLRRSCRGMNAEHSKFSLKPIAKLLIWIKRSVSVWDALLISSLCFTMMSLFSWWANGAVSSSLVGVNIMLMTARLLSFARAVNCFAPLVHMFAAGPVFCTALGVMR
jgi:hypothetical protein